MQTFWLAAVVVVAEGHCCPLPACRGGRGGGSPAEQHPPPADLSAPYAPSDGEKGLAVRQVQVVFLCILNTRKVRNEEDITPVEGFATV